MPNRCVSMWPVRRTRCVPGTSRTTPPVGSTAAQVSVPPDQVNVPPEYSSSVPATTSVPLLIAYDALLPPVLSRRLPPVDTRPPVCVIADWPSLLREMSSVTLSVPPLIWYVPALAVPQ